MNKKGFTLIELLAVIVILSVIALIATPAVLSAVGTARAGANKETARGFLQAAEFYCAKQLVEGAAAPATVTSTAGVVAPSALEDVFKGTTPYTASITLNTTTCVASAASITVVNGGTTYSLLQLTS
jgi:type IV pilus assembly protein PilA